MSLSARFGLTVTFQQPERPGLRAFWPNWHKQHGIDMPMDYLLVKAETFAIRSTGIAVPRGFLLLGLLLAVHKELFVKLHLQI